MKVFAVVFSAFTISLCTAAVLPKDPLFGNCLEIKTDLTLDLVAFSDGKWYEISKTTNSFEGTSDCVEQSFMHDADNQKFDLLYSMRFPNGSSGIVQSSVTYTKQSDQTQLDAVYPDTETTYSFDILDSDTTSWAIIYSCYQISNDVLPMMDERIWVLSREPTLSQEASEAVDAALIVDGSSLATFLYETNQDNCIQLKR